ncbi:hypothetical protein C8F04DRAFT_1149605 [Mycena alexandri]|uniref:Uncharacterized protein n=1 Tax=Mycena alexandri TaxID=1745969 RepID=A0AAD6WS47_9AGAR|nr:hypothetical protein C8F04DRAFT_1149605 [Mycena alexandri]
MCVTQCGTVPEAFNFPLFSSQFSSFMLPFLALTAQLPFGAPNHIDNFSTIMLTIGSPTLAIFSLMITILNSRWIKWRFERIRYPNSKEAVIILNNLQQSLLRVKKTTLDGRLPFLASQIVIPQNDQWWQRGAATLAFTHTWSIANIASVGWAVVAYIFVIASMDPRSTLNAIGPAVACPWLWLLPVVVGWLQTSPNCDEVQLRAKLAAVNETVYIRRPDDDPVAAPVLSNGITDEYAIEIWPRHRQPEDPQIEEIAQSFAAASIRANKHETVDGSPWTPSDPGVASVHLSNRVGKAEDIGRYIQPEDQRQSQCKCWAPGVWRRVAYSSVVACTVQWSCTGSAILAAWMTPTVGLGCHSASFLLHGALSTISFTIIRGGVILEQHYHSTNPLSYSLSSSSRRWHVNLSILCRRVGKIIAWVNACLFITLDLLRFANIFKNCFCESCVFGLGVHRAYNVVSYGPLVHFENWWIASVAFATTAALSLWISVFILKLNYITTFLILVMI